MPFCGGWGLGEVVSKLLQCRLPSMPEDGLVPGLAAGTEGRLEREKLDF